MKKITIILIFSFLLVSCSSVREGFTLKKKSSVDEFLVEKKSPLVLPPDYGKLPVPQDQLENSNTKNEEIKSLISNEELKSSTTDETKSETTSIEKSILEKIK
tara:strand:+ start:41 stop:349 length:309 start_codon:yes stop_codon:yes gene_type:complete